MKSKLKQLYNKLVLPKHWLVAYIANIRLGWPARGLRVIAVTGTNGKTSTCFLIHKMLLESGQNIGLISTVGYGVGDKIVPMQGHMTSMPAPMLLSRIKDMRKKGMEILVLEVTSHALSQYRTLGVPFSIGVFTNLTHEHLDYHGSFDAYKKAKKKLFKKVARNKNGLHTAVVNIDDPVGQFMASGVENVLSYSTDNAGATLKATNIQLQPTSSRYNVEVAGETYNITCNLPGTFNISNSLAAVGVGQTLGLNKSVVEKGIASLTSVDGRMTRVDAGQDFDVIVDFAHTPDAIKNVLTSLQKTTKGSVSIIFGATGNRDTTKRAPMGEAAGEFADRIYLTDDETYQDDPAQIRADVMAGIVSVNAEKKTIEIGDRREAIIRAFKDAKAGDVVVLAGLGHQPYREMHGGPEPWVETEVATEIIIAKMYD